ncbi:thiamine pyrophosphate-binding protein [Pigmentiphaga sp. NML030171]|uniref:thiamine pyrophosphate-dependent enzyme n=1 Tax=Pigmentiphaga sp. NML030171 TaxID=2008676 RepID=UPI000B412C29|nr:thiamine pyrophosphate-dependent enzyme [Pigmentiphaga sp. NML030171]OVZ66426.1 thiamine pyrophosphate-binding protein [Pigmentiphaga sp. NML030171]
MNDSAAASPSGGELLVRCLIEQRVDLAFCVPGESYLDALDALFEQRGRLRLIVCRHEAAAANMAEAYGKLTGKPGVCFVTRGPGATHASIAVHTAHEDETPLVLFVGQVARGHMGRGAFQEVDYRAMFGGMAKWVAEVDDPARLPEIVARAFQVAAGGRPGPVVLALPEDVLEARTPAPVAPSRAWSRLGIEPTAAALAQVHGELARARKPLLVVGGGGWSAQASEALADFARTLRLPVVAEFRCQDYLDNRHDSYAGDLGLSTNPALAARVRDSDLLLVLGGRLSEALTGGYRLVDVPRPRQRMIHVHADVDELGRVYQADVLVPATPEAFLRAALAARQPSLAADPSWQDWTRAARSDYLRFLAPTREGGTVDMAQVVATLDQELAPDAIVTNGAGNYTTWLHRHYRYKHFRGQLAPLNGAMGYGLPAAIAAKIHEPRRQVVCLAGDGCFLMNVQELETAVRYNAAIVVVVVANGSYGTIRAHQERRFPGRVYATDIGNPDFVALARSFGLSAERVTRHEDFAPALRRALDAGVPSLIELPTEIEHLSAQSRLSAVRDRALAAARQHSSQPQVPGTPA